MIFRNFFIYNSDFNICTGRARIYFNMKRNYFENALVEKSESSAINKEMAKSKE